MFRNVRVLTVLLVAAVNLSPISSANAAYVDDKDYKTCVRANFPPDIPDTIIAACDRAIASHRIKGRQLADVYYQRAFIKSLRAGSAPDEKESSSIIADYTEAIRQFETERSRDRDLQDVVLNVRESIYYSARGSFYRDSKRDYKLALADFNKAIELTTSNLNYYTDRAGILVVLKEFDRALADCDEYIKRIPAQRAIGMGLRAVINARKGDYDRAIAEATEAITLDGLTKNSPANFLRRGMIYEAKGDYPGAIADYGELIRQFESFADFYSQRGLAYFYGGAPDKALADFDKALALTKALALSRVWEGNQKTAVNNAQIVKALWLDIAARRNGQPTRLPELLAQLDMTGQLAPLALMFLGKTTPERMLDDVNLRRFACELNLELYAAEFSLISGAKNDAIRHFRAMATDCERPPTTFLNVPSGIEFAQVRARAGLKALGATP